MEMAGTTETYLEASEISLRIGGAHVVTLGGLASAGYVWSEAVEGGDGVVSVSTEMGPAPAAPPPGSPPPSTSSRDVSYRIVALKPGNVRVRFELRRPWEGRKPPLREVVVTVSVTP